MNKRTDLMYLHSMALRNTYGLSASERTLLDSEYATQMTKCLTLYGHQATNDAVWRGEYPPESE